MQQQYSSHQGSGLEFDNLNFAKITAQERHCNMMMSSSYDTNLFIDETWIDFNTGCSQMLSFINPDEICPMEHMQSQPLTTIYQQQKPQNHQQNAQYQQVMPYRMQQVQQVQSTEHLTNEPSYEVVIDEHQADSGNLGPPPVLIPKDEYKFSNIQQRLDYERALSQQRREQLRMQLEREPPKLPANVSKRPSGKKLTGRERQLELEKTEAELLKQRDRYVDLITKLESKCQKLRELLGNIVLNSPEYNSKFVNFLDSDGLFVDSHINGLTD